MRVTTRAIGIELAIAGVAVRGGRAGLVFMRVVADVLLRLAVLLVLAISRHRRRCPLQRQDEQKKDGYELAHAGDANSSRAWRTTAIEAVSARVAITPATSWSGQAVPVPNTPRTASTTTTLPLDSIRRLLDFVAHAEAKCGDINQLIDEQLARAWLNACVRWSINLSR
jgi:hypothetical protein